MICKNCRQEIPDDSKFCTHCGTKQETDQLSDQETPEIQTATITTDDFSEISAVPALSDISAIDDSMVETTMMETSDFEEPTIGFAALEAPAAEEMAFVPAATEDSVDTGAPTFFQTSPDIGSESLSAAAEFEQSVPVPETEFTSAPSFASPPSFDEQQSSGSDDGFNAPGLTSAPLETPGFTPTAPPTGSVQAPGYAAAPASEAPPAFGSSPQTDYTTPPQAPGYGASVQAPGYASATGPAGSVQAPGYAAAPASEAPPAYGSSPQADYTTPPQPGMSQQPFQPPAQSPAYAPQPAPAQTSSYGSFQPAPQQTQSPTYSGYAPVYPVEPPKKKTSPLVFVIIGVVVLAVIGIGIYLIANSNRGSNTTINNGNTGSTTTTARGWTGGTTSPDLPEGYTAIVDNEYVTIGFSEIRYYSVDDTIYVKLYIINRSDDPIYIFFYDSYFDSEYADYELVYSSIERTEPHSESEGVVWIDALHNVRDLNNWYGTIIVVDADTLADKEADLIILDEYDFDVTYHH
ncbi:MAG: zinc-ribbon domain-containing protein [Coriobacteriia bacterium]|nr:zinc-ribbon domain-containing protein [Coriobacteriia bacterium]